LYLKPFFTLRLVTGRTAEVLARSQAGQLGICGGQSGIETGFPPPRTWVWPVPCHSISAFLCPWCNSP